MTTEGAPMTSTRLEDVNGDGFAAAIKPHPSIPGAVRVMVATNGDYPERAPGLWIDLDAAALVAAVQAAGPDEVTECQRRVADLEAEVAHLRTVAQREHHVAMHWTDRGVAAEAELLRSKCTCVPFPQGTGPEEDCPAHGRTYAEWIERGDLWQARSESAQAKVARVEALADEDTHDLRSGVAGMVRLGDLRAALDGPADV